MKNLTYLFVIVFAAILFASCNGTAVQKPAGDDTAKADETKTESAEDINKAVIDIETKAHEAWKNKDGKFFEDMLSDDFVGIGASADKAGLVKLVSESECDVKEVSFGDAETTRLDDSVVLITGKVTADFICDGKKGVSPEFTASVFVKDGDSWKGTFHQSLPAADAEGEAAPVSTSDAKSADDELTKTLLAAENKLWEAWSKKDGKVFEDAATAGYVGLDSSGRSDKAKLVKDIAESKCEVKSFSTDGFKSTKVTDNVVILTYIGKQDATCDGNKTPDVVFASTVYVKEGDAWKFAFHIETPVVSS